jgi:hypothetical protein
MRVANLLAVCVVLVSLVACGKSTTAPSNTGTLSVMLKDSPFSDAKALLVTSMLLDFDATNRSRRPAAAPTP